MNRLRILEEASKINELEFGPVIYTNYLAWTEHLAKGRIKIKNMQDYDDVIELLKILTQKMKEDPQLTIPIDEICVQINTKMNHGNCNQYVEEIRYWYNQGIWENKWKAVTDNLIINNDRIFEIYGMYEWKIPGVKKMYERITSEIGLTKTILEDYDKNVTQYIDDWDLTAPRAEWDIGAIIERKTVFFENNKKRQFEIIDEETIKILRENLIPIGDDEFVEQPRTIEGAVQRIRELNKFLVNNRNSFEKEMKWLVEKIQWLREQTGDIKEPLKWQIFEHEKHGNKISRLMDQCARDYGNIKNMDLDLKHYLNDSVSTPFGKYQIIMKKQKEKDQRIKKMEKLIEEMDKKISRLTETQEITGINDLGILEQSWNNKMMIIDQKLIKRQQKRQNPNYQKNNDLKQLNLLIQATLSRNQILINNIF